MGGSRKTEVQRMISITPQAAAEISRLLEDKPESVGFRVYVNGFG